ncbi:hypothetical protein CR194_01460 [Salipaludibacillus keqinensis]|uniref:Uncharacterized protein n=1 Tax=Salipaludibacillus keqinensis TaxID=2045207 RepID=A0A323TNA3_9BACI|nr:hypothetical protein [Salipaludibacillus keqinensis]PYZ94233.1 hypothetical protein CR194_01460 [Salipaludibacillus keqinensis]
MGQLLLRAGALISVLMFGFILGIIYSDQEFDFTNSKFHVKEESTNDQALPKYELKDLDTNEIKMGEDGIVVYEEGKGELHDSLQEELPSFVEKAEPLTNEEASPLFSELGLKTAGAFEHVFQKMFSVLDGN